jgi:TRAP-type C4-dicarboxylate transport system permease small subunit
MRELAAWLHRRAENIAAGMLAVMFLAFLVQIVFRYFFNFPVGWASELTVALWLWLVLWGASFVLKESEEIRFDLLSGALGRRARIAMGIVVAVALVVLYGMAFKPSLDYVTFMKVEKSSYLKVRMDWMYSIFIVFLVAILARYLWLLWQLVRGRDPGEADVTKASSGL